MAHNTKYDSTGKGATPRKQGEHSTTRTPGSGRRTASSNAPMPGTKTQPKSTPRMPGQKRGK